MKFETRMKFIDIGVTLTIYLAGVAMGLAIAGILAL